MATIRNIFSSFRSSQSHSGGNENGKNDFEKNDNRTLDTSEIKKESIEKESMDQDKMENYIFLLPPATLLLAILLMYILNKIFY